MKQLFTFLALFFVACLPLGAQTLSPDQLSCTSIMVGKKASPDGSVIVSHTCDGRYRTWMAIEPAADHRAGEFHKVYKGTAHTVSPDDTTGVRLAGEIPQVRHTYAYLNTAYPCMNEHQLAIGETTFGGPDTLRNPNAMFLIEELQRVALQRCKHAREAVLLIGDLIKRYGYADGGECITIADPNEIWQMEIIGEGADSFGGVWVAQRVPDDEVAVSANIPRIGLLRRDDRRNFLCSDNVEQVALNYGLWDGQGDFIFWKAFNTSYAEGHNFRDREFFIFNTLAPSRHFSYDMAELPFSVRPDAKVDIRKVIDLFRSTYEGTDMDMCRNIKSTVRRKNDDGSSRTDTIISPIANPWLTTNMQRTLNTIAPGTVQFRRTVSVAWCSYSFVAQLRSDLPDAIGGICWISVDNPAQSPRIPIFCGTTELPASFSLCGQKAYAPEALIWKYRKANKLATLAWQSTKKDFMRVVLAHEQQAFDGLAELQDDVLKNIKRHKLDKVSRALNDYTASVYKSTVQSWQSLESKYWHLFGMGF